jgi:flagellar biosynthesis protein FlhB
VSGKTEQPTPRRLHRAAAGGDVPVSTFANQAVALLAAIALVPSAFRALAERSEASLRLAIGAAGEAAPRIAFDVAGTAGAVVLLAGPLIAAAAASAAATSFVQSGGVLTAKPLKPDLGRLSPLHGLQRLLAPERLVAVARAGFLAAAAASLALATLRAHAADLARSGGHLSGATALAGEVGLSLAVRVAVLGLFVAIADVVVTRHRWRTRLMMTPQEIKRERKESERDPEHDRARARAREEMLAAADLANVERATVVVTGVRHLAIALRYEDGDLAPAVVASGRGALAERLVRAADAVGVPVVRDDPLAHALMGLTAQTSIPEALYERTAEILREAWDGSPPSARPRGG